MATELGMKTEAVYDLTVDENDENIVKDEKLVSETLAHETDEFEMLMSLALDRQLTPGQARRFEDWLAQSDEHDAMAADTSADTSPDTSAETAQKPRRTPRNTAEHRGNTAVLAAEWMLWQELDAQLTAAPHVAPPADFAASVMQRLAVQERRRRLWLGGIIGVAAILLWGTGALGVLGLAALISANQSFWLGEFVQSLAYWWSAVAGFFVSALRSAGTLLATAQARAIVLVYCTLATGLLSLWWVWLRRTTQAIDETSAI